MMLLPFRQKPRTPYAFQNPIVSSRTLFVPAPLAPSVPDPSKKWHRGYAYQPTTSTQRLQYVTRNLSSCSKWFPDPSPNVSIVLLPLLRVGQHRVSFGNQLENDVRAVNVWCLVWVVFQGKLPIRALDIRSWRRRWHAEHPVVEWKSETWGMQLAHGAVGDGSDGAEGSIYQLHCGNLGALQRPIAMEQLYKVALLYFYDRVIFITFLKFEDTQTRS